MISLLSARRGLFTVCKGWMWFWRIWRNSTILKSRTAQRIAWERHSAEKYLYALGQTQNYRWWNWANCIIIPILLWQEDIWVLPKRNWWKLMTSWVSNNYLVMVDQRHTIQWIFSNSDQSNNTLLQATCVGILPCLLYFVNCRNSYCMTRLSFHV